jgi:hypothetical protein
MLDISGIAGPYQASAFIAKCVLSDQVSDVDDIF